MRIHVVPASDAYGREHYNDTIQLRVSKNKISEYINDSEILNLLVDDSYAVWGVKKGKSNVNHKKWLRMNRGDICLFYRDKKFFSAGKVICKFEHYEFSKSLWGGISRNTDIGEDETWENMFLFDEIKQINIPVEMFNKFMGFKVKNIVQGYNNYDDEISDRIIEEFELSNWQTSSYFNPEFSPDDNRKRIQDLLQNLSGTDAKSSGGQSRKEQSLHREHHFGGKTTSKCSLCHKELPVNLLHAGHIKPRRDCDDEERKDLNVTMPVCKLGCDDLYEKGYIVVDDQGFIKTNNSRRNPNELVEFINQYEGKKCLYHNSETSEYFKSRKNYDNN